MENSFREAVFSAHRLGDFPCVKALMAPEESAGFSAWSNTFRTTELAEDSHDWLVVIRSIRRSAYRNPLSNIFMDPTFKFLAYVVICLFLFSHLYHSVIEGHRPPAVMGRIPSSSRIHVSSVPMLPSPCTTFGSMAIVAPIGRGRSKPAATTGDSSS